MAKMLSKSKRLRVLARVMLAASVLACVFGLWLVISSIHKLADLDGTGEAVRSAIAPVVTELAEGVVLAVHYFFVSRFFIDSLKEGVPFTKVGAKELRILGYETLILPVLAWIASAIAYSGIESPLMILEISVYEIVLGFALIIMSYVLDIGSHKMAQGHRGHLELMYIGEHHPEILKEARIAIFGTENKNEEEDPESDHYRDKREDE